MSFSAHGSIHADLTPAPQGPRAAIQGFVIRKSRKLAGMNAQFSRDDLKKLATSTISPFDPPKVGPDAEENTFVPSGYTYFGQFVDHDLTFDTTSTFDRKKDPAVFQDQRTPRFDLDCVYGNGPDDQPYLYDDNDGATLLLGDMLANGIRDVQRNGQGRAIIGDKRNDENSIVVQIQSAFIRFHNLLVQEASNRVILNPAKPGEPLKFANSDALFDWARNQTRWHYQSILLHDYLPRILDLKVDHTRQIIDAAKEGKEPPCKLFEIDSPAYMPAEFSGAAYRFGHSMVRPGYQLAPGGKSHLFSIFAGEDSGLRGFKKLDFTRAIDWNLFFTKDLPAGTSTTKAWRHANDLKNEGRIQFAYKIDTMLVDPLGSLPLKVAGDPIISLAERNLLRGLVYELPSGEQVATSIFGVEVPLKGDDLSTRKGNKFRDLVSTVSISPSFEGKTPLWFYVLAEACLNVTQAKPSDDDDAEAESLGTRLGPVGGGIVAETFAGLLWADRESVVHQKDWLSINNKKSFSMPELLEATGTL